MCWSGEASAVIATIGLSTSFYTAYKGEDKALYMPLIYFSLMEALQAFTYSVINKCSLPSNQIATLLGYLHIVFQPFFIHSVSMYFIPKEIRSRIAMPVYTLCFIASILMLIQLYPFDWAGVCKIGRPLCSVRLCSVFGNWHIAWDVPLNGIGNTLFDGFGFGTLKNVVGIYTVIGFMVPLLYGSWRFTLYHLLIGPILAASLTNNVNERPAVWCLLSIGLLLLVVKSPIRQYLHVKNYGFLLKNNMTK